MKKEKTFLLELKNAALWLVLGTSIIWLSYYPFHWVNKLGLYLRGNLIGEISNPDSIERFAMSLSSLGIIFFVVTLAVVLNFGDNEEEDKESK